jgi:tetratricopeptide (TPR) repeat protein
MIMTRWHVCAAFAATLAVGAGARAEGVTDMRSWKNCGGGEGVWIDLRVSGCTEVIKSGKAEGADLAKAYYNRANAQLVKAEYAKAIDDYSQALALTPDDASALHERCFARAVMGKRLEDALSDCNEALRLAPNDAETLGGRGFVYLRLGFYRTAILDYDAALKAKPDAAEFLYGRGTAKLKAGDDEAGKADLAAARKAEPTVDDRFARYDEASGTGFWAALMGYWRAAMTWIY